MGVEDVPADQSTLVGILAQRLVRTICGGCYTKYFPDEQVLADAEIPELSGHPFHKGVGCQQCHNSGYRGRKGIYEVMEVTTEVRKLIHNASPTHVIREGWQKSGGRTLRQEGVQIAIEGHTNLEEVLRVTHVDEEGLETAAVERSVA